MTSLSTKSPNRARLSPREIDSLLDLWARWIHRGRSASGGFASMLEMMMATHCQFSGGGGAPNDEIETRVEGGVALLTKEDKEAATVLRVEYGVWTIKSRPFRQIDKAVALRMSLNQYKRKLKKARDFVGRYVENRGQI